MKRKLPMVYAQSTEQFRNSGQSPTGPRRRFPEREDSCRVAPLCRFGLFHDLCLRNAQGTPRPDRASRFSFWRAARGNQNRRGGRPVNPLEAVLDTNVLIAGLRSRRGASFELLRLVGNERWRLHLSTALLLEYEEVARREARHFWLHPSRIEDV